MSMPRSWLHTRTLRRTTCIADRQIQPPHAEGEVRTSWVLQRTPALDSTSMKPPSCGACGGHPIPNICVKPFGVGWRLCASEQRDGAFEGCGCVLDHLGMTHSCLLPPSPRRGPVDGTGAGPTKSPQARQVGGRSVSKSLKLGFPQRSTT